MKMNKESFLWVFLSLVFLVILFSTAEAGGHRENVNWDYLGITGTPTAYSFLPAIFRIEPSRTPTPTATSTPTQTPTVTPTLPPSSAGNIVITYIFYNGAGSTEPDEYVEIRNDDTKSIQLQNWTLRDIANHNFTFPSFVMMPGKICRIYTNEFHPEWCGFSYGSSSAIWNNTGDCAYLNNSAATQVDSYCY